MTLFLVALAAGYVAAVFTWPKVKEVVNGAEAEAAALKAKAETLLAKAKAAL